MHIMCGIGNPDIHFEDLSDMSINISNFKKDPSLKARQRCELCGIKVETFKSSNEHSVKHCHILCALKTSFMNPKESSWKANFSIISQEGLPLHKCIDEEKVSANIKDTGFALKEIIEHGASECTRKKYESLLGLKAKKAPRGNNKPKKDLPKGSQESGFFENILKKAMKRVNKAFVTHVNKEALTQRDNDEYAQKVGGKIVLLNKAETPQNMDVEEDRAEETTVTKDIREERIRELYKVHIISIL